MREINIEPNSEGSANSSLSFDRLRKNRCPVLALSKEKAARRSGRKSWEETPMKGSGTATLPRSRTLTLSCCSAICKRCSTLCGFVLQRGNLVVPRGMKRLSSSQARQACHCKAARQVPGLQRKTVRQASCTSKRSSYCRLAGRSPARHPRAIQPITVVRQTIIAQGWSGRHSFE